MLTRQKIIQISKQRLFTLGFGILLNVILAGSVCGTFAWYTYATRAGFEDPFHGTTIGSMGSLQIGFISNFRLTDSSDYGLTEDLTTLGQPGKYIYWSKNNTIPAETFNYVVSKNGYGTTKLGPVTSGAIDLEENPNDFHLYRRPKKGDNYSISPSSYAAYEDYVKVSFVFKTEEYEPDNPPTYEESIYLTRCHVETSLDSEGKELYKSVRTFVQNKNASYIINPTSESDGINNVGGILDLDFDGFYDFDSHNKEIVYGQSKVTPSYLPDPTSSDGDIPYEDTTTFSANHKKGIYALDEENYQPETVKYSGFNKFANRSIPAAVTDPDYNYLMHADLMIYMEGWDLHLVTGEENSGFNMDLNFSL